VSSFGFSSLIKNAEDQPEPWLGVSHLLTTSVESRSDFSAIGQNLTQFKPCSRVFAGGGVDFLPAELVNADLVSRAARVRFPLHSDPIWAFLVKEIGNLK